MEVPKMKEINCKLTEIKATAIQSNILRKYANSILQQFTGIYLLKI